MQNFPKAEKLSNKIYIEKLYQFGKVIQQYPFRIHWLENEISDTPVKVIISAPKRNFKKAVDRNKIKRRIREAYRKHKTELLDVIPKQKFFLSFVYTAKIIEPYDTIEKKMIMVLKKIAEQIHTH